jgi:hypothetical protein
VQVEVYRTFAEEFEAAMKCKTPADAKAFATAAIARRNLAGMTTEEARAVWLEEVGQFAAYYNEVTRADAERLYGAVHPVFGHLRPTPEEAGMLALVRAKVGEQEARRLADLLYSRFLCSPVPEPSASPSAEQ